MFSRFSPSAAIHEFRDRQEVQNGGACAMAVAVSRPNGQGSGSRGWKSVA